MISGIECGKIKFLKKQSHISMVFSDYFLVYSKNVVYFMSSIIHRGGRGSEIVIRKLRVYVNGMFY
jgi:hypothetical protein